jgi:prevent-host-death family protein
MHTVNMLEAKTNLSRLVEALESGAEREIVISRNGRPVARLVPLVRSEPAARIGAAAGRICVPDDIDVDNERVAELFGTTLATGKVPAR